MGKGGRIPVQPRSPSTWVGQEKAILFMAWGLFKILRYVEFGRLLAGSLEGIAPNKELENEGLFDGGLSSELAEA